MLVILVVMMMVVVMLVLALPTSLHFIHEFTPVKISSLIPRAIILSFILLNISLTLPLGFSLTSFSQESSP